MKYQSQKGNKMTATGEPLLKTQPEVDTRAWEFLIDTSKVSFDAIAVFTTGAVVASTHQNSQPRPAQPPLNSVSA
jgi:hypothetical protein